MRNALSEPAKNGSGKHQHQDHIEQPAIDQALTGGVESIVGGERGGECRSHQNATGSIRNPVTAKKIGIKKEFPKNSNFAFAGLSLTAALTASPARNAPTIPRRCRRADSPTKDSEKPDSVAQPRWNSWSDGA
jgi:hypothetical protein